MPASLSTTQGNWDVFISHATEDKAEIAKPLAEALARAGLRVWYDDFTLKLGDGLSRSIDRGLAETRYGIVILSPSFFAKEWPRRELDGLTSREVSSGKVILPVWHKISRADVEHFSPILADKLGVSTDQGLDVVVSEILQVLHEEPTINKPVPKPKPKPKPWRIVAAVVAFVGIAIAAMFSYRHHQLSKLPDVAGQWVIEATDKTPKTYIALELLEGKLSGNTKILFPNHPDFVISGLYARRQVGILDGQVVGKRISFSTKRQYTRELGRKSSMSDLVHRYEGRVEGKTIQFAIQVEGGYYEKVTAERVPAKASMADPVATLQGHTGSVDKIVLLTDGRLATASRDQTVKIWNLSTAEAEASFEHRSQVRTVIPLPEEQLISAESDGKLRIWDIRTRKEQRVFQEIDGLIENVIPIGDGKIVGSWSQGEITVWDIATGRISKTLKVDDRWILKMALLRDGRLATGDQDGAIRIWNLTSGQPEVVVRPGKQSSNDITGFELLKDGRLAYSTANGTEVTIWDSASGQKETVAPARRYKWAQLLSVLEDGRLAILDSNGDIMLWHPTTRKGDVVLNVEDEEWAISTLIQLPDGRLAMGTGSGPIKLWKLR
jgi:hypothetical protein